MKTKLDQISIPPLCRSMSEMGPTLVVKQRPATVRSWVETPVGLCCRTIGRFRDTMGNFFLLFFCFDFPCIL